MLSLYAYFGRFNPVALRTTSALSNGSVTKSTSMVAGWLLVYSEAPEIDAAGTYQEDTDERDCGAGEFESASKR
jgi:hypothetical protein